MTTTTPLRTQPISAPQVTVVAVASHHSGYSCLGCDLTFSNPFTVDRHVIDTDHSVVYTLTESREIRKVTK